MGFGKGKASFGAFMMETFLPREGKSLLHPARAINKQYFSDARSGELMTTQNDASSLKRWIVVYIIN
jgi:hypothetical protein